jgi:FkbM family methyltransferase
MTHTPDALELPGDLQIDTLIDVGVAEGTPWLYDRFPDARLVLIDPMTIPPELAERLSDRAPVIHKIAVGAAKGGATLHVDLERTSRTSLYARTALTRTGHAIEQSVVALRRLDDVAGDLAYGRLGIKIDTEGHELEVLKGAEDLLDRCAFILCEVSMAERFVGSYQSQELIAWLCDRGFGTGEVLRTVTGHGGQVLFSDMLFTPDLQGQNPNCPR